MTDPTGWPEITEAARMLILGLLGLPGSSVGTLRVGR